VSTPLVQREKLAHWGFLRLPDVWVACPFEGRRKYVERWYHAAWNFTAIVGWPERDPLRMSEEDFLALVQGYLLEDTERVGRWPWDDLPEGL
jgi:hypothetical protein